ncbi:hypothetical protein [Janthinobacterium sp. NKUCC06_STL]|uniref:hypothetical protein n=1 Tax=Janthinobacterium sp. NKUCC06_STL TaxID=2842127 RepID=UPI001C5B68EC|nr:hypothetical protein [Janthinobacterium sp. NKUCC06_STL]MBW3508264.1 hypothetical protein [Janthinobacterium sp. NKUCC06_STL]
MHEMQWGLLAPEWLNNERRTRTLDLGVAVRTFNDLAVPGMGGVWFGRQLFLATLGVAVAQAARARNMVVSNIETANAIEALACLLALRATRWESNERLRGAQKMRGTTALTFAQARQRSFYVTQPMRMATVQALPALGLVSSSGEQFNSYACTPQGYELISRMCHGSAPRHQTVLDYLTGWVLGQYEIGEKSPSLLAVLSPLELLPLSVREWLREQLEMGSGSMSQRRRDTLRWMDKLYRSGPRTVDWHLPAAEISDADHWRDLHVGALFFQTRDAAIALLEAVEVVMSPAVVRQLPLQQALPRQLTEKLAALRTCAGNFLLQQYDPTPDNLASTFCMECHGADDAMLLRNLVQRDGQVLQLRADRIIPGAAFRATLDPSLGAAHAAPRSDEESGIETAVDTSSMPIFPDGISRRIPNFFYLNLDLHGERAPRMPLTELGGVLS